jgi:2-isopropylmalate synthase
MERKNIMIEIFDTTLRDGTQREGISVSCYDKIRIAQKLDELGVAFIEGGWPGSNPKDAEFFTRAKDLEWKHAVISSFGATCRVGGGPENDANIRALLDSGTKACTVVGKTWTLHVTEVLRTTLPENLRIIETSLAYLKAQGRRVIYDAEHFFDGYKADAAYALETLQAAARGGAETIVLCDTNGGTMPWEISEITRAVRSAVQPRLGIHCHNDSECAVANTLAAVQAGVMHVQGTINGYGERCGNANLCSIIPDLELKLGQRCLPDGNLRQLFELSHFVTEVVNLSPNEHLPYVGGSAFAHKGGIHVAAMRRNVQSYQHIDPTLVGNDMRVVVSELSGRGNLLSKLEQFGMQNMSGDSVTAVLQEIKELESRGFSFEAAEASVALLLKRQEPAYRPPFELVDFLSVVEHRRGRGMVAEAMVKVMVDDNIVHTAAEGDGPVNALDQALRKALIDRYPSISKFHLDDYKVRILDSEEGTAAATRVLIDTASDGKRWSTVGASTNIIEASWQALADSFEYGLMVV